MWPSRIFWRLFGAYGVLLAVSLGLLGWVLVDRLETHLLSEMQRSLEVKTLMLRELVAAPRADLQAHMKRLGADLHARITLIAQDGTVLADSAENPEVMEKHDKRAEVQVAEQQGIGVATRYSGTVHQPMMYVARRNEAGPIRYVRIALSLDAVAAEVSWLSRVVWATVGITLMISLLLSFLIARRITSPAVELALAADAIARGDYGKRIHAASSDEIGSLAGAFNSMSVACAGQIKQMEDDRERLRSIFRSMVEGVLVFDAEQNLQFANEAAGQMLGRPLADEAGKKLWQLFRHRQLGDVIARILDSGEPYRSELEWTASERKVLAVHGVRHSSDTMSGAVLVLHDVTHMRKLERVRQDFVANVSHELKTPLATIQASVETLLDGALHDPDHNMRFLERIRENAERLSRLVLDLLTLGRVESGQELLDIKPIVLQDALAACLAQFADRAAAKQVKLESLSPDKPVIVQADDEALAVILDNLTDNAIKYTSAGGTICLRLSTESDAAVISVEDTGVGIPSKDLPRIFERFYRVDKARSRELGGTGLGLSIVKHLVHALGGTITANSEVGTGSKFFIRLPLDQSNSRRETDT